MNKEELLECLKRLSITNNERDGIDVKKEEAQLIIEIINNYKKILDKIKEYAGELRLFDNESVEFEISNKILELLEEIDSETRK